MDRERVAFLTAVTIIATHVVDDSFVNPEPGTSAADHLLSGLVPLTALGVATAVYLRSRAGVRACTALVVGLFGIVASVEGWYYTLKVGPSGDDFTGLITIVAGVVLLVLGALTLWRSRHMNGRRWARYLRRFGVGVVGLVLLVGLVGPFMMTYTYTHIARAAVPAVDLGGAEYENVTFETSDGLELEGWYIPSRNGAAVISFPGRAATQDAARFLAEEGYGVLLFDRRGEGMSDGDPNALGWGGGKDIEAAIAFLQDQPDVDPERIGGIGRSVGGELMLEVAAEDDELKAVVSEGAGIRSFREASEIQGADKWLALPIWTSITAGTALFSNNAPPPNLIELVSKIAPRPVLLIYAEHGQGGEELSADYFEAAGDPKQVWMTDSGHVGGYAADPDEYADRVVRFFDDALL